MQALRQFVKDNKDCRLAMFNVWQPLKTVYKDPVALLIRNPAQHKKDAFPLPSAGEGFKSEIQLWKHNPEHVWVYLGKQSPDEILLMLQYDSHGEDWMGVAHAAFSDSNYLDSYERESVDTHVIAVLPDNYGKL